MIRDVHVSEDILQQALMKGVENPPPEDHSNRRAWLGQVIRNSLRMHFRSHGRRRKREAIVSQQQAEVEDPLQLLQHREVASKVREAVEGLREPYRATLIRHYWDSCSLAEIAVECGVSPRTVETRLRRGRALMRSELSRRLGPNPKQWMNALLPLASGWQASPVVRLAMSRASVLHGKTLAISMLAGSLALPILVFLWQSGQKEAAAEMEQSSVVVVGGDEALDIPPEVQRTLFETSATVDTSQANGASRALVPIVAFDSEDHLALAEVSLRVLNLATITDSERLRLDASSVYREEASAQEWRILSSNTIVTGKDGRCEVAGHPGANRVLVVPGAWTPTHSLGFFAGTEKRSSFFHDGAWTKISLPFSKRTTHVEGVVLGQNGNPIPNASIYYWFGQNWGRFETPDHIYSVGLDGVFAIEAASSLDYGFTLVAEAQGQRALYKFFGEANHPQEIHDVVLQMAPAQEIWVQVQDEKGIPLAGASVTAHAILPKKLPNKLPTMAHGRYWISQRRAGITDRFGRLSVIGAATTNNTLVVNHPGFEKQTVTVGAGQAEAVVSLQSRSRFSGYVSAKEGVSPANFQVYFAGYAQKGATFSKDDGAFELCFEDSNFRKRLLAYKPGVGITWSAELGGDGKAPIEIPFEVGHSIVGSLQRGGDSSALPKGELQCFLWQQASRSPALMESWIPQEFVAVQPTGDFSIEGIPAGRYLLVYELDNGQRWKAEAFTNGATAIISADTGDGATGQLLVQPLLQSDSLEESALTVGLMRTPRKGDLFSYEQIYRAFPRTDGGRFISPLVSAGDYVVCLWSRRQGQHFHHSVTVVADTTTTIQVEVPATIPMRIQIANLLPLTLDDISLRVVTEEGLPVPGLVGGNRVERELSWRREGDSFQVRGFPDTGQAFLQIHSKVNGSLLLQRSLTGLEREAGFALLDIRRQESE